MVSTDLTFYTNLAPSRTVDLGSLRLTGQSVAPIVTEKHNHAKPHRPEEAGAHHTMDRKTVPD